MQTYLVGGAVRASLLALPVQDRDWVVVGATPEQRAAQSFLPVGKNFPVYLHPVTQEDYALARTERKTAPGDKEVCGPCGTRRGARARFGAARHYY